MSNYYNYANIDDANTANINANPNTNTNTNTNANNANNAITEGNQKEKPKIYEDFMIFGNFFGLVSEPYVKYFNLFGLQMTIFLYNLDSPKNNS